MTVVGQCRRIRRTRRADGRDLVAVRRLTRTQDGQHAVPGVGVIDMDRHEAALVMVRVEQRQLLVAMHGIGGIIDVEGDGLGWPLVAPAPQIHGARQTDQRVPVRGILPTRQGRLRGEVVAALGQTSAGQFERRILAQIVEVVGIGIATGDSEMRARRISAIVWVIWAGSRWSGMSAASVSISPRRRSAPASSRTPPSELMRPPSKAAVTFFWQMLGSAKGRRVSLSSAGMADFVRTSELVSAPNL